MILQNLFLKNFRSFKKQDFPFSEKTTLILGPNTAGKTNILEAIYLLATGRSFRAEIEQEMISYGENLSLVTCHLSPESTLEIMLTRGEVMGQRVMKKLYKINGVSKRMIDFVGILRAVLFWPEDLELVTNSPSTRRKYLDLVLSQVDREYRRSLFSYEKGLRQRNKLLERIRDEGVSRSQLAFWDKLLIKNGGLITDKRAEFIEFINKQEISDMRYVTSSHDVPHITSHISHPEYRLEYDKSVISDNRLMQYSSEEVAAAATLVGPHRDDLKFVISDKGDVTRSTDMSHITSHMSPFRDLSIFGSRGEQRLAILWLKLAELEFISSKMGERPILLLDDIFSELDHEHREYVLKVIPKQQTIMTTTDLHLVNEKFLKEVKIIKL